MPFTNPLDAYDEVYALFEAAWNSVALVSSLNVETRWAGNEIGDIPEGYFVRVSKTTVATASGGFLQNGAGASPQVFDTSGLLFVQVFGLMSAEDSARNCELLARAARDIFRGTGTANGVWFRNAFYTEAGNDGKFYMFKVTAEYEFSER